jgi:hypothetical protein
MFGDLWADFDDNSTVSTTDGPSDHLGGGDH